MKKLYRLVVLFAIICFFLSCEEELNTPNVKVAVSVSPSSGDTLTVSSGDNIKYELQLLSTASNYVKHLKITSFDVENGERVCLDETFEGPKSYFEYVYTAPVMTKKSVLVTLSFQVWDNEGNTNVLEYSSSSVRRYVWVNQSVILMQELTGVVLYLENGLKDALSFSDPTQTVCQENIKDSSVVDMYVAEEPDGVLNLFSKNSARFVRANNFNYAKATALNVQSVFSSSVRSESILDLSINDIVLVGHGDQAEGVFFVSNIIRTGNDNERCVQLSYKSIK